MPKESTKVHLFANESDEARFARWTRIFQGNALTVHSGAYAGEQGKFQEYLGPWDPGDGSGTGLMMVSVDVDEGVAVIEVQVGDFSFDAPDVQRRWESGEP